MAGVLNARLHGASSALSNSAVDRRMLWNPFPEFGTRLTSIEAFRALIWRAAASILSSAEALAGEDVQVVHAGVARDEGQKVHKLRAALRALRPDDQWLVFIDADIEPPARLVGRLLFPLVRNKADIVTGYRLLLPGRGLMAAMVGAVEMQLATLPRAASATMPWGGAMALSRAVELEPENADYRYTLAVTLHDLDQSDAAQKQLETLLSRQPANRRARVLLIQYWKETGQLQNVQVLLAELERQNPDDPFLQQGL